METIGNKLSDAQTRRRLLLAAYLIVAVPVSSLLWQLLSPPRQIERQAWLPMRDAVAPLPPSASSLFPHLEEEPELDAAASPRRPLEHRPTMARRLTDTVERLLGRHGVPEPAAQARGMQTAGRGRLSPFSSLLGGIGGSGQSQAGVGVSNAPAPGFASAGPLGSVGLVTAGTSKRFTPARLQRNGAASGFMRNGRGGGVRLMNQMTLEPDFRAAASAGLPGFLASGQLQPGGLASVGGEVGMGEGNKLDDKDDSSSTNPALPLSEVPEPPTAVDAFPGLYPSGRKSAACGAYTQAVTESSALLESLRAEAKKAAEMLRNTADKAAAAAEFRKGRELEAAERTERLIRESRCTDVFGSDSCAGLRQCLARSLDELDALGNAFAGEIKRIGSVRTSLQELPPAGEEGFRSALAAIAIEEELRGASSRYFASEKGLKPASVPEHLATVAACRQEAARVPRSICVQRSAYGCIRSAGVTVGPKGLSLSDYDQRIQDETKTGLDKSWCGQPSASCQALDEAALLRDLNKHVEALRVWEEQAPKEPVDKTADAAQHLERASSLLKSPKSDFSRNLVNGTLELERAADAMGDASAQWSALRDEACKAAK